jgi:hypothetical protein
MVVRLPFSHNRARHRFPDLGAEIPISMPSGIELQAAERTPESALDLPIPGRSLKNSQMFSHLTGILA